MYNPNYNLSPSLSLLLCSILLCYYYGCKYRNYSTVDRLWSILPAVYSLLFLIVDQNHETDWKLIVTVVGIVAWGFRLSFNFYRKGGYQFFIKLQFERRGL